MYILKTRNCLSSYSRQLCCSF